MLSPYRLLVILTIFLAPILFRSYNKQRKLNTDFSYVNYLVFWLAYSFIPLIWLNDYAAWAKSISFLFTGLISSFLIFLYLTGKNEIIKALQIIIFISVLYACLGLYEMFSGNYLFVTEQNIEYYQEFSLLYSTTGFREPVAVFGNPNNYALFLFFCVVFSFLLFKIKTKKVTRIFYLMVVIVSFFLIFCTQSRSGFIGTCIFFSVYGIHAFLRRSVGFKLKVLFVILIVFIALIPKLIDNVDFFRDVVTVDLSGSNEASSDGIRRNLIKNGFVFLYQTLFLGVGLGNIEYYVRHFQVFNTEGIVNMHNWWMEVLVSSGLLIFVYYIAVYTRSMIRMFKKSIFHKNIKLKSIYSIWGCSFLGFIIASIGASSLIDGEWFWALMAISMKAMTIDFSSDSEL